MNDELEEHAGGVDDSVVLAAPDRGPGQTVDLLADVIAAYPAGLRGFYRLAVYDACTRLGVSPLVEMLHRRDRRKVPWQLAPLAAC